MENELKGLVFNIQKFSIQDGPGIRTTVFMKGCPLNCPWCSNPEGMSPEREIMTNDRKCIGCKKCIETCTKGAISFDSGTRTIDWDLCDNCLECSKACPSKCIETTGKYMSIDEAFKIASQDKPFYVNSGGGVTVSGGEALLQWEFVKEFFKECKQAGIHTTLDTTAYCKWENMKEVLEYTDLILFDVKHMDPAKHKEKTGISNDLILRNLEKASKNTKVWLRIPFTPGFNDSEENMRKTAELAEKLKADKISLLPYHEWGKQKYTRLGRDYTFNDAQALDASSKIVTRCKEILESYNLNVDIGE